MRSQKEMILSILKNGEKVTPLSALRDVGSLRLSAIIFNLKKEGHPISMKWKESINRFGKKVRFAEYSLERK